MEKTESKKEGESRLSILTTCDVSQFHAKKRRSKSKIIIVKDLPEEQRFLEEGIDRD